MRVGTDAATPPGRAVNATDSPGVVAFPPLLYAGAFVSGSLVQWFIPIPILPMQVAPWGGVALLTVGAVLAHWSRHTMESAGTNVHPALPATALVASGPFRFSRNPMYLARTVLYLGLASLVNGACLFLLLAPLLLVMHYGVIKREERYLEAKFGEAYRRYRADVRRWI